MKMSKRSKIVIYALLGLVALYFLAPFIYMLFSAFKTESEAIAYPPKLFPTEWHFENFINAWKSQPFGTYLWNSILVTVFTTLGQVLSCSLVAYRATIDNDMYKKDDWMNKYFIQKPVEETEYVDFEEAEDKVIVKIGTFFSCYNQSWGFECVYVYEIYSCGQMKVEIQGRAVQRGKLEPPFLPRIGIVMKGNQNLQNTMWYGMGPGESYIDSNAASVMGIYESTIDEMMTNYVFPQENGHRENVKWFSIGDGENGLLCRMENKLGLNLANYTDESLEKAQHPFEIEKSNDVIIHLDYRHSGLGSNSCGEEQLEENKVKLQDFSMAFTFSTVKNGTEINEARKQYI